MTKHGTKRQSGVELGRVLGCFFVILLHQSSESWGTGAPLSVTLSAAARWAVPFFFIVSGYFINPALPPVPAVGRFAARLLPVFVFWCAFYLVLSDDPMSYLDSPGALLRTVIYGGPGYHLWFLSSLGLCLALAVVALQGLSSAVLLGIGLVAFLAGLVLGPYRQTLFDAETMAWLWDVNTRNGPLFGLVFVAAGCFLRTHKALISWRNGILLLLIGAGLSLVEVTFLSARNGVSPGSFNAVLGTLPLGLGAAMLFLSIDIRAPRAAGAICAVGAVSLGIYAVHVVILRNLTWALTPDTTAGGLSVALLTMALSVGVALLAARVPVLRRVFS